MKDDKLFIKSLQADFQSHFVQEVTDTQEQGFKCPKTKPYDSHRCHFPLYVCFWDRGVGEMEDALQIYTTEKSKLEIHRKPLNYLFDMFKARFKNNLCKYIPYHTVYNKSDMLSSLLFSTSEAKNKPPQNRVQLCHF